MAHKCSPRPPQASQELKHRVSILDRCCGVDGPTVQQTVDSRVNGDTDTRVLEALDNLPSQLSLMGMRRWTKGFSLLKSKILFPSLLCWVVF